MYGVMLRANTDMEVKEPPVMALKKPNASVLCTTVIIIAQRISSVQYADKIVVLDEGTVSAVGTHSELMEVSPIYREIYDSQQEGGGDNG